MRDVREISGQGAWKRVVDGRNVLVGNGKLMAAHDIAFTATDVRAPCLYVAADGTTWRIIVIADTVTRAPPAPSPILRAAGVRKTSSCSRATAHPWPGPSPPETRLDGVHAELLPQDKVAGGGASPKPRRDTNGRASSPSWAMASTTHPCSPAPTSASPWAPWVRTPPRGRRHRAHERRPDDIAPRHSPGANHGIVRQNIVFALGVQSFAVLVLAAFGIANMWMAVFADVGVAVIAIFERHARHGR